MTKKLNHVALLGLGQSQLDYHLSLTHSVEYDEVWAVNSMCAVVKADRVFMMDPASRFFETKNAGAQTEVMRKILPKLTCPVYSCEYDKRVPAIELYPLEKIVQELGCGYFNNTIAYAIAYALWMKVKKLSLFGADFSYTTNVYFGELGRACCEFWLSRCITAGMEVSIAPRSSLLDTNVPENQKLYGYHRLENPPVVYLDKDGDLKLTEYSEIEMDEPIKGYSGRQDNIRLVKGAGLQAVEPASY